jgi:hypothetical protein
MFYTIRSDGIYSSKEEPHIHGIRGKDRGGSICMRDQRYEFYDSLQGDGHLNISVNVYTMFEYSWLTLLTPDSNQNSRGVEIESFLVPSAGLIVLAMTVNLFEGVEFTDQTVGASPY